MKKIFSLALMATALLISGQVKAEGNVAKIGTTEYATMNAALTQACDKNVTIELLQDAEWSGTYDVTGAVVIDLGTNGMLTSPEQEVGIKFNIRNGGSLEFKGTGTIVCKSTTNTCMVWLYGSSSENDSNVATLIIGANVTVSVPNCYFAGIQGVFVDSPNKRAYGTLIDIYGEVTSKKGITVNGNVTSGGATTNLPTINIHYGAKMISTGETAQGIYAAGYAVWNIEGYVQGATGIYVKGGVINITGKAEIVAVGAYADPEANNNGATATGDAIILDSKTGYPGGMQLNISGEPTISSANAYAVRETKTDASTSQTSSISITGGNFDGSENGCINTTNEIKTQIVNNGTIIGGTFSGDEIKDYVSNVNGVIDVTTSGSETVYVVNGMQKGKSWVTTIAAAKDTDFVKVAADEEVASDKEIAYLNIPGANKVTVKKGAKLSVGEAVLGEDAVIEVEAGGKLVINGTNGLIAFVPENLVIKADATDGMGTFVLNPAVKANKSPYATVEYMTNQYCGKESLFGTYDYHWDVVASPFAKIDSIISVSSYFSRFVDGAFEYCNRSDIVNDVEAFNMFAFCPNTDQQATKYTFYGKLQGVNDLNNFPVTKKFNYLGNAYTGKMNAKEMVQELQQQTTSSVRSLIYLWDVKEIKWVVYTGNKLTNLGNVNPMAAIVLYSDADDSINLNYEKLIWNTNK